MGAIGIPHRVVRVPHPIVAPTFAPQITPVREPVLVPVKR